MGEAYDGVGRRQHERGVAFLLEGVGDADGDEEHSAHRHHHRHAQQPLVGARLVAEPGVGAPAERHQRQHDQSLQHAPAAEVVLHQAGDVGDRVDEDEVEEQLQRGHPMAVIGGLEPGAQRVEQCHLDGSEGGEIRLPVGILARAPR